MKSSVITLADYQRDWMSLYQRIFEPDWLDNHTNSDSSKVFKNSNWRRIPLPWQIVHATGTTFPTTTNATLWEDEKVKPWDAWQPFFELLKDAGENEFLVTNLADCSFEITEEICCAALYRCEEIPIDEENFDDPGARVYSFYPVAFDRSARWGIVAADEDLSLLGGEEEFVEQYVERAGGLEVIQQRYLRQVEREFAWIKGDWSVTWELEAIGWPRPKPDDIKM